MFEKISRCGHIADEACAWLLSLLDLAGQGGLAESWAMWILLCRGITGPFPPCITGKKFEKTPFRTPVLFL